MYSIKNHQTEKLLPSLFMGFPTACLFFMKFGDLSLIHYFQSSLVLLGLMALFLYVKTLIRPAKTNHGDQNLIKTGL